MIKTGPGSGQMAHPGHLLPGLVWSTLGTGGFRTAAICLHLMGLWVAEIIVVGSGIL